MIIEKMDNIENSNELYGGDDGPKLGIILNNEKWFLKFSKYKSKLSKYNSPLSEYLGSQIYNLIGLDVHETKLAVYKDRLTVACKDFKDDNEVLYDFNSIKNLYIDIPDEISSLSHTIQSMEEITYVMDHNDYFEKCPDLRKQFWDMFVIDAFIGNHDRNNGNWGILVNKKNNNIRVTPVYDNGASFNNKLDDNKIKEIMENNERYIQNVYHSRTCAFSLGGNIVNPLKLIESELFHELNEAIIRIVPNINLEKINKLIDDIPNSVDNILVISDIKKEFIKQNLKYIYDNVLITVYQNLTENR